MNPDGGRREIDMVLIGGNQILVVEQKHWAGHLRSTMNINLFKPAKMVQILIMMELLTELLGKPFIERIALQNDLNEEQSPEVRVIVAMTHQKLEWPKIPNDLAAEMVNEKGFIT